jgi:hypothetical protein
MMNARASANQYNAQLVRFKTPKAVSALMMSARKPRLRIRLFSLLILGALTKILGKTLQLN